MIVNGLTYNKLPRIFLHLQNHAKDVIEFVRQISPEEAKHHWNLPSEPNEKQKISEWAKKIIFYSSMILDDSQQFIFHLLGVALTEKDCPREVRDGLTHYGIE